MGLDREAIRAWYNGYNWLGAEKMYNPYDILLQFDRREFKLVELTPQGSAMGQLKERGYADKYRGSNRPVWLIGIEFSREARNIAGFDVERA